jgi:enterochelin esterase-like enzyme
MHRAVSRHRLLSFLVLAVAVLATTTYLLRSGGESVAVAAVEPPRLVEASGPVVLEEDFFSPALGRTMSYLVYLPPGYYTDTEKHYPVLYMLHGLGSNRLHWARDGLFLTATKLIGDGEIPPMIIVTPDGERGYWLNHSNNGPRWGSYVAHDLIDTIDSKFRTLDQRNYRAIGGMSMGAHGALQLALNNPDRFSTVGAHSVALRTREQAFDFFNDVKSFEQNDPVTLCIRKASGARQLNIYVDIGTGDGWYAAAQAFHQTLQAHNIPHAWRANEGGHDDAYWRENVDDYLRFYGRSFLSVLR